MTKTPTMRRVERHFGKTLEELLPGLFERLHTQLAVAEYLGVDQITLVAWLDRLGAERTREVRHITTVRFRDEASVG